MSNEHEMYDELAVGWALHALEPEDEDAFVAHLADCDRCARTVAETVEMMAAMATELPPAEPSAELGRRLQDAVARTEQLPPEPPRPRPPVATGFPDYDEERAPVAEPPQPAWRRALPALLGALAVTLIVALGVWNVVLADARSQADAAAAAQSRILSAVLESGRATIAPVSDPADPAGGPVATVVARDSEMLVVSTGLRVNNAADSTYVVWGVESDQPVALGTFDVVHTQMDVRPVGSTETGLDAFSGYAISLEPGRTTPKAPSDIVAKGVVTR
jgi:anti-sigma-K factor RskA